EQPARAGALAVAEPAYARRQSLEAHARARRLDPAHKRLVLRELLNHRTVSGGDVRLLARQRDPTKRALALAEQGPDVRGDETRVVEGTDAAAQARLGAEAVAVVEDLGAPVEERDHRVDVSSHARARASHLFVGVVQAQLGGVLGRDSGGDVAQRVVGRRLVGDDVDLNVASRQLGHDLGGVAEDADGERLLLRPCLDRELERVLEVARPHVEVAVLETAGDPLLVDLDANGDAAVQGDGERLRAAHAAEAGGQSDRARERAAEPLPRDRGERLVRPLQDALRADVDPRAGRQLALHRQSHRLAARGLDRPAHFSRPATASAASITSPLLINASAAASSGATTRSGPTPLTCLRRSLRTAPVAAAGSSGARISCARAAAHSSTARMLVRLSSTVRSLSAAPQPIETWSSCMPEVGT